MMSYFLTALGLLLVLEGILPFLSPNAWRRTILLLASQKDGFLRKLGISSMLIGLLLVYVGHHYGFN